MARMGVSHGGAGTCLASGYPDSLMSSNIIMSNFDTQSLSISGTEGHVPPATTSVRPPRHRPGKEFLKGPIPLSWLVVAASLRGKALATSLAIWFKAGATNNRSVKVTGTLAMKFAVGRKAKTRCLAALESAGLIIVARHPGRNPVATILDVEEESGEQLD